MSFFSSFKIHPWMQPHCDAAHKKKTWCRQTADQVLALGRIDLKYLYIFILWRVSVSVGPRIITTLTYTPWILLQESLQRPPGKTSISQLVLPLCLWEWCAAPSRALKTRFLQTRDRDGAARQDHTSLSALLICRCLCGRQCRNALLTRCRRSRENSTNDSSSLNFH